MIYNHSPKNPEPTDWSMKWMKQIKQLQVGDLIMTSPDDGILYLSKKEIDQEDPFLGTVYYFKAPGQDGLHKKDYWGVVYTLQVHGRIVKRLNKM